MASALAAITMVTGGGGGSSPYGYGELGENQQILASCDPSALAASLVKIDGTGSRASVALTTERVVVIELVVGQTAIYSGRLRVIIFSSQLQPPQNC
jgi:hypothetical protein